MLQNELLKNDCNFDAHFFFIVLVKTDEFTPAELQVLRAFEWERINTSTPERRERTMRVLRISKEELNEYLKQMRIGAIKFVKKYS